MRSSWMVLAPAALMACHAAPAPPPPSARAPSPPVRPAFCVAAEQGVLKDVVGTPAGPYFVHSPSEGVVDAPTLFFVPGGPGSRETAEKSFELWLSRGTTLGRLRVIVPYSATGKLPDESDRLLSVLDEALACYGGSPKRVHLAGTSNGGRGAFALMLRASDRFSTLLGAPGLFAATVTDDQLRTALSGKAIFNAAGELDEKWRPQVMATHERLQTLGLRSEYADLPGQGHILTPTANQESFFAFWSAH